MSTNPAPIFLHHYCTPSTFLSIIEKKELWLTSLTQSNDRAEGSWALGKWVKELRENNLTKESAYLTTQVALTEVAALGCCFAEEFDLLSQWRGYAADGAGFSITFDRAALEADLRASAFTDATLCKVNYKGVKATYDKLEAAFGPDYRNLVDSNYSDIELNWLGEAQSLKLDALKEAFQHKNDAFDEENEWRILLVRRLHEFEELEFREARNELSPFVRVKFLEGTIKQVTLGPSNTTPTNIIKQLLEQNGISVRTELSMASYRARS